MEVCVLGDRIRANAATGNREWEASGEMRFFWGWGVSCGGVCMNCAKFLGRGRIGHEGAIMEVTFPYFSDIVRINSSKTASQRIHLTLTDL